jgi:hypothetical protein
MAVAAKDCHELTSYYAKVFKEKYGSAPNVNRHTARWGFDSVLQGMSKQEAKDLLDFYFETPSERKHNLDWFFYNYDKLVESKSDVEETRQQYQRLMEESKIRAEAWRKSGKQGIANSERSSKEQ